MSRSSRSSRSRSRRNPLTSSARGAETRPEALPWCFCHYIHFFVDAQAGEKWTSEHPGTYLISLEEAFELGRLTNDALLRLET
jgi:hypothetical protein